MYVIQREIGASVVKVSAESQEERSLRYANSWIGSCSRICSYWGCIFVKIAAFTHIWQLKNQISSSILVIVHIAFKTWLQKCWLIGSFSFACDIMSESCYPAYQ